MATIPRPITKTVISSPSWGIPITDQVNANTTDIAALKPTAWTNVTFQNGWTNISPVVQYRKIGDIVYIRGTIGGGSLSTNAFNLPVGFRTPYKLDISTGTYSGSVWAWGKFDIDTAGNVTPQVGGTSWFIVNCSYSTIT